MSLTGATCVRSGRSGRLMAASAVYSRRRLGLLGLGCNSVAFSRSQRFRKPELTAASQSLDSRSNRGAVPMRGDPFDLRTGDKIDRYELLVPVASGGTSQIWAARLCGTRGFEKLVALKTLAVPDSGDRELERMLWHEARLAARIQHPNVAQCFELLEHERALCLTLEWIDGESLSALLRESWRAGGVPLGVALQIAVQACKGLHAAHELCDAEGQPLGLVHCDVSPQNLMIDAAGTVKWVDFGIAKVRHTRARGAARVLGKPSFMAP